MLCPLTSPTATVSARAAQGCQSNDDGAIGEYCAKEPGDCDGTGTCTTIPDVCINVFDPVCGCDGNTYTNSCFAAAAGVNVAFDGSCEPSLGRCCQGGVAGVVCLVNTEDECMSSGQFISWEEGLDCPDGDATCEVAAPLGRCCQGGFAGVVCLVNTEEECMSSGQFISWEEGLDCPDGDATCD